MAISKAAKADVCLGLKTMNIKRNTVHVLGENWVLNVVFEKYQQQQFFIFKQFI